ASAPQNCREMKAQPSSTESIAAPCVGLMPISLQNATRWEDGIDIGTQQQNPARQIIAWVMLGCKPSTRRGPGARLTAIPRTGASGAGFSISSSGGITIITTTP